MSNAEWNHEHGCDKCSGTVQRAKITVNFRNAVTGEPLALKFCSRHGQDTLPAMVALYPALTVYVAHDLPGMVEILRRQNVGLSPDQVVLQERTLPQPSAATPPPLPEEV